MTLSLYYLPLFPTTWFEYKRNLPGLQAVFSGETPSQTGKIRHFPPKTAVFKQLFDSTIMGLRKIINHPRHNILCLGWQLLFSSYKIQMPSWKFPKSFRRFSQTFTDYGPPASALRRLLAVGLAVQLVPLLLQLGGGGAPEPDPLLLHLIQGHLDMIRRAAGCFDRICVCVSPNAEKRNQMFTPEQKLLLVRTAVAELPNVEAELWPGLLADFAVAHHACAIVRGVRNTTDFDTEYQLALINRGIHPELETVLLPASPAYQYFSSSMAREMIRYRQPLEKYLPASIVPLVREIMNEKEG